jgi:hypothetical protein
MRIAFLLLLALAIPGAGAASTDATVFPPSGCSSTEMKVIAWQNGASTTYCLSGQEVLALAMPVCAEGANVVKQDGLFKCKVLPKPCSTLPSGAACTNTAYVSGASSICNYPGENVRSMVWKTIVTYKCDDGTLTEIGRFSGEGACSNLPPGETIFVNECP